jgi:hypothetical protein
MDNLIFPEKREKENSPTALCVLATSPKCNGMCRYQEEFIYISFTKNGSVMHVLLKIYLMRSSELRK